MMQTHKNIWIYLNFLKKQSFSQPRPIRIKDLIGPNPVRGFSIEFAKVEQTNKNAINLALGVPFDPTAPHIVQAKQNFVQKSGKPGQNGYGDSKGYQPLLDALSVYYQKTYQISQEHLSQKNILITAGGSSNALSMAFEQLSRMKENPNQNEIIILSPFFGPYVGMVKLGYCKPVFVDTDSNFEPDIEKIKEAITPNTLGLIINSPNNPTGQLYSEKSFHDIFSLARQHKFAILSDEVYERYVYTTKKKFLPLSKFFGEYKDLHLITTTSPSKTFGMIGDRVGYIMSNNTEFIEDLTIKTGYRYASIPYLPQAAMVEALTNWKTTDDYINQCVKSFKDKGEFLVKSLRKMEIDCAEIEGGMFVMANIQKITGTNGNEFSEYLLKQEIPIAIYPGSFFGQNFRDYMRFSICPDMTELEKGMKQLEIYIKKFKSEKK